MYLVQNNTNHTIVIDNINIPVNGKVKFNGFKNQLYINRLRNNHKITVTQISHKSTDNQTTSAAKSKNDKPATVISHKVPVVSNMIPAIPNDTPTSDDNTQKGNKKKLKETDLQENKSSVKGEINNATD